MLKVLIARTEAGLTIVRIARTIGDKQSYLLDDGTWWDVPAEFCPGGAYEGCGFALPSETSIPIEEALVYEGTGVHIRKPGQPRYLIRENAQ
jgi:hypothetical protein